MDQLCCTHTPECSFLLDCTKPEFLVDVTAEPVPLLPPSAHRGLVERLQHQEVYHAVHVVVSGRREGREEGGRARVGGELHTVPCAAFCCGPKPSTQAEALDIITTYNPVVAGIRTPCPSLKHSVEKTPTVLKGRPLSIQSLANSFFTPLPSHITPYPVTNPLYPLGPYLNYPLPTTQPFTSLYL